MKRIIKFRGKRIDNGEWAYGGYSKAEEDDGTLYVFILDCCSTLKFTDEDTKFTGHRIKPRTLGQFTGLKDKNGFEIYEGDIVRFCDDPPYCSDYIVKYDEEGMIWIADGAVGDYIEDLWELECEFVRVIGNIHDNPEMLEL